MVRTLYPLVVCALFAVSLVSPQRMDRVQRITSQQRQQVVKRHQQQAQVSAQGPIASRSNLNLIAVSDAELQRFLENEEAVTAMTQCFITPKKCSSKHDLDIVKKVRGLGPGGACKTCTKEEQDKLHQLIYEFIQYYIARYPILWRRLIPHLGNLITFVPNRN